MKRALKIENLKPIDKTAVDVLRVISLHLGDEESKYVDYDVIAKSLNITRDTVAKAVNRMVEHGVLRKKHGKLSILNSVLVQ